MISHPPESRFREGPLSNLIHLRHGSTESVGKGNREQDGRDAEPTGTPEIQVNRLVARVPDNHVGKAIAVDIACARYRCSELDAGRSERDGCGAQPAGTPEVHVRNVLRFSSDNDIGEAITVDIARACYPTETLIPAGCKYDGSGTESAGAPEVHNRRVVPHALKDEISEAIAVDIARARHGTAEVGQTLIQI